MTSFPQPETGNEVIQNGGRKRKGRHFPPPPQPRLGWRHFRRRHLGFKMAAPHVTSGGCRDSREDVPSSERGRPSTKTSHRRLKLFFYFLRSIWSLASPNHSRNGWGSCPLATTGRSTSLHVSTPCSMKRGVDLGKHLLYFFLNCSLQYTWIIVEYNVIVGRSLVWLETNINPTMTILLFSWILSTKRQWQSSASTRPVWQRQKGVMSQIQSTDHEEAIFDRQHQNGELVRLWRCPDCDSQNVQHEALSTALQLACPATLHS